MISGKRYYWLSQLLGWGGFFLLHIFLAWSFEKMSTPADQLLILKRSAGFSIIGLFMTHCLRITIIKFKTFDKKVSRQIWMFILLTALASFIAGVIEFASYRYLDLLTTGESKMAARAIPPVLLNNFVGWFTYFIIWSAIYFIYHYIVAAQKEQIDALKLKSHIKELELKTIKAHINPHFIFNSLNGIRALVDENPGRARTAITELSNILRSSINIDKMETIPLNEELNIVRDYLALEQMRFEDRLRVEYEIPENTLAQQVPPMMLQILVENAIKHGISHEVSGGTVKVASFLKDHLLEIEVANTGTIKEQQEGGGYGIKSIKERLQLLYNENGKFEIRQLLPRTVIAKITIPITL